MPQVVYRPSAGGSGDAGTPIGPIQLDGEVNDSNTEFILPFVPIEGTLLVIVNGVIQCSGYTVSGQIVTFDSPPSANAGGSGPDQVYAQFRY